MPNLPFTELSPRTHTSRKRLVNGKYVVYAGSLHTHLTKSSPFKVKDSIPGQYVPSGWTRVTANLAPIAKNDYVLDAVKADTFFNSPFTKPKRPPIIKPYDAKQDRFSAGYFRSPAVQDYLMGGTKSQPLKPLRPEKRGLHRLSARRRSLSTPPSPDIRHKEKSFVLDNVRMERSRTKGCPIGPQYNAMEDRHSANYFKPRVLKDILPKLKATEPLNPSIMIYAPNQKNDAFGHI